MRYVEAVGVPSRWTVVAAVVVALAIGGTAVDYVIAAEQLGPYPQCRAGSCGDQHGWLEEAERRSADIAARSWLSAAIVLAAVAGATARALRRRPAAERRTIFANLGSVGVVLGVLFAALLWFTQHATIDVPIEPGWTIVGSLLAAAALGGTFSRLARPEAEVRFLQSGRRRYFDYAAVGAAVLTTATLILAVIFIDEQSDAPVPASELGWNEGVWWAASGTSLGAAVLALVGLVARHWFTAAACLFVNAALLAFMVVSTLE